MKNPNARKPSIRAARTVGSMLETVGPDNRVAYEAALPAALEYLIEMKKAQNAFSQVLVAGFEDGDPVKFLAAIQLHRDMMADLLSKHDEHIGKVIEGREDQHVAHVMNRMTGGEFRIATDTGNWFTDSDTHKALRDRLRDVAGEVIANRSVDKPVSAVRDHIEAVGASADGVQPRDRILPSP